MIQHASIFSQLLTIEEKEFLREMGWAAISCWQLALRKIERVGKKEGDGVKVLIKIGARYRMEVSVTVCALIGF